MNKNKEIRNILKYMEKFINILGDLRFTFNFDNLTSGEINDEDIIRYINNSRDIIDIIEKNLEEMETMINSEKNNKFYKEIN